jgi:hypothetical protein
METYLTRTQIVQMGWPAGLVKTLLGPPDLIERKVARGGRWAYDEHSWRADRVKAAMSDERYIAAADRRKAREAAPERRREEWARKFHRAPWLAPAEAAKAMFSLNRYAKHSGCGELRKVEIYQLKDRLIEALYAAGYCAGCWEHVSESKPLPCRECAGMDGECYHCAGTGIWRSGRSLRFICFRFLVAGQFYSWHQPADQVKYPVITTEQPQGWSGIAGVKPVPMPKSQFGAAIELVQFVLERPLVGPKKEEVTYAPEGLNPVVMPDQGSHVRGSAPLNQMLLFAGER